MRVLFLFFKKRKKEKITIPQISMCSKVVKVLYMDRPFGLVVSDPGFKAQWLWVQLPPRTNLCVTNTIICAVSDCNLSMICMNLAIFKFIGSLVPYCRRWLVWDQTAVCEICEDIIT